MTTTAFVPTGSPHRSDSHTWWARREDVRLVTGTADFTGDVDREGQLYLRVVRNSVAHGTLRAVDVDAAAAAPGVVRVLTAADLPRVPTIPLRILNRPGLADFAQPVLASDRVRYVGEPIAVVVAESPALAEDAADLVEVDVAPLPPVLDLDGPREVPVWEDATGDVMCRFSGRDGDVESALAGAHVVVTRELSTGRDTGLPLETRGLVAEWADDGRTLHLWGPVKLVRFTRQVVASWFGLEPGQVLCHHVDVGGMFGTRGEVYPEDFLVPWAASVVRVPVKWVEDSSEHLVAINHSRGQIHRVTAGAKASGELVALRVESVLDYGAYARPVGGRIAEMVVEDLPGPYRWGNLDLSCRAVATTRTPTGTMRGPAAFDTTFARERILDLLAAELGRDPIDLRRQNLIRVAELPYVQSFGAPRPADSEPPVSDAVYDSGDYHLVLDRLLEAVDLPQLRDEVRRRRAGGELVGYGVACFLDHSADGREETVRLDLLEGGRFRFATAGSEIGQGLASMVARVGAEALGVPEDSVVVVTNDSAEHAEGNGTFASRSTIFVGSAAVDAAAVLRRATLDQLGRSVDAAPDWSRIAPRTVIGRHVSAVPTFGFGAHLALVRVDPHTADVAVERLAVAYDCGRAIDLASVRGQLVGAAVQGLGGTLYQELTFDAAGQPQSTTFLDFQVPTLAEVPPVQAVVVELPGTVSNPLGAKGVGEAGIKGVGAAVANAVSSALAATGAVDRLPIRPDALLPFLGDSLPPPAPPEDTPASGPLLRRERAGRRGMAAALTAACLAVVAVIGATRRLRGARREES